MENWKLESARKKADLCISKPRTRAIINKKGPKVKVYLCRGWGLVPVFSGHLARYTLDRLPVHIREINTHQIKKEKAEFQFNQTRTNLQGYISITNTRRHSW